MRISDWSSDVCSSDLVRFIEAPHGTVSGIDGRHSRAVLIVYRQDRICRIRRLLDERIEIRRENAIDLASSHKTAKHVMSKTGSALGDRIVDILSEIGRASCRERVCQYE